MFIDGFCRGLCLVLPSVRHGLALMAPPGVEPVLCEPCAVMCVVFGADMVVRLKYLDIFRTFE